MLSEAQREVIDDVCAGHSAAADFCEVFVSWCHWIDDVVDADREWTAEALIQLNCFALPRTLATNPFFQKHKASLLPLIVQGFAAYLDSELFRQRPGVEDRRAAEVLKSFYHEVVWHIAYLLGGWDHSRAMTAKHREFDYDGSA